ncbi:MAG: putative endonuclease [Candidatus Petromonas sp.]|nr:putative endonuclease [Candidatus Petromonas sp.]
MKRKKLGEMGEKIAAEFLKRQGYNILHQNYRCRFGEIDIVAKDNSSYVFIEVKTRRGLEYGRPIEAINKVKINRMLKTLQFYLKQYKIYNSNIRVDAMEIIVNNSKNIEINHIKNIIG